MMLHPSARFRVALLSLQVLSALVATAAAATTTVTSIATSAATTATSIATSASRPSQIPSAGGHVFITSAGNHPVGPWAVPTVIWGAPSSSTPKSTPTSIPAPEAAPTAVEGMVTNHVGIDPAPMVSKSAGGGDDGGNGGGEVAPTTVAATPPVATNAAPAQPQTPGIVVGAAGTTETPSGPTPIPPATGQPQGASSVIGVAGETAPVSGAAYTPIATYGASVVLVSGVPYTPITTGETPGPSASVLLISGVPYTPITTGEVSGPSGHPAFSTALPSALESYSLASGLPVANSSASAYLSSTAFAPYPSGNITTITFASSGSIDTSVTKSSSHYTGFESFTKATSSVASATSSVAGGPSPTETHNAAGLRLAPGAGSYAGIVWMTMMGLLFGVVLF